MNMLNKFIRMGKNNNIHPSVKLIGNVTIGNNNTIYENTIIYPNTIIGDNNIILNGNIIGEHPIIAGEKFKQKHHNGVIIGNNNFFHINNVIFSGYSNKTIFGNNNKILAENHFGHDCVIYNNVHIYPRCIIGGYTKMLDYSGLGMYSVIHQNLNIGPFSFIGMNNSITKNIFPFYININNKYNKLNYKRISEKYCRDVFENNLDLIELLKESFINNNIVNDYDLLKEEIDLEIRTHINDFLHLWKL